MSEPKVSIIIAVYNTEKYLKDCIESVLSQDYENIELFLVDDGSTDGSPAIMDSYVEKYPSKVVKLTKENGGQASARNLALDKISGEYLTFMDSDDYIAKDYIRTLITEAAAHDADMVASGQFKVGEDGHIIDTIRYKVTDGKSLQRRLNIAGKLYRTSYVRKFNIKFPEGKLYEDNSFNFLAFFLSPNVRILPYEGYNQVVHEGSTTAKLIDHKKLPFDNWSYCIRTVKDKAVPGVDMDLFDITVLSFFTYFLIIRNRKREYLPNEDRQNSMDNAYAISDMFENMTNEFFGDFKKNKYRSLFSGLPLKQVLGVRVFYSYASKKKLRKLVKMLYRF